VFSFGKGGDGQLGHLDLEDQLLPRSIEFFSSAAQVQVIQIDSGFYHSALLTSMSHTDIGWHHCSTDERCLTLVVWRNNRTRTVHLGLGRGMHHNGAGCWLLHASLTVLIDSLTRGVCMVGWLGSLANWDMEIPKAVKSRLWSIHTSDSSRCHAAHSIWQPLPSREPS
jgi:hypothetical protein